MFRVITSGHVKVSGLGFLGSITSKLSNLQGGGGGGGGGGRSGGFFCLLRVLS